MHPRSVLIDDAAALLGVSRRTVYYRIREGKLRTIPTGGTSQRVLMESIEAVLWEKMSRVKKKKQRRPKKAASAAAPVAALASAAADPSTGGIAGASSTNLFARSPVLWQQR